VSRYRDGIRVSTTIFEAAAFGEAVKVLCSRCPNAVVFDAGGLWWRFHCRGWDDSFGQARHHFFCLKCAIGGLPRVRPGKLEAVRERPAIALQPDPPEREWKRALKRFRT
jgi:hypothetical protein